MSTYGAGSQPLATLTGAEKVTVDNGGAGLVTASTALIAGLAGTGGTSAAIKDTAITTVGNGTLTAAAMIGGQINRSGPTAAFTDTTDTAAAIVAALPEFVSGATFFMRIKNSTAYLQTISAGTGVTLPTTNIVAPFQTLWSYGTIGGTSASPTVVFTHMLTDPLALPLSANSPSVTTLATNGAGTVLAIAINGGIVSRTTVAAAFADTTDTAAAIIAGNPGLIGKIGTSFIFIYANNSTGVCTLGGGTGVTVSAITTIPPGVAVEYLVTYTAAATLTMVGLGSSEISPNNLVIGGATSGQVTITTPATAGAAALVLPPNAAGTLASTTASNLFVTDVYRCTAPVTANATVTYATVTGLSGAVVVGTYRFRAVLPSTVASGTGGIKYAFHYTTAVLSALEATGIGYTASAVAVQHTTTTTDVTDIFTQAAVVIMTILEGTFTVSTGGTIAVQMAQNTSNASNTVALLGCSLELCRIA